MISLLLGFYALGQLDANLAGLALMAIGIGLFVAETFTPTFGVLALGGTVAFVLGAMLLFDQPGLEMPWVTILTTAGIMAGFALFAGSKGLMAQRRQPTTGVEGLIGQRATVKSDFQAGETGSVFVAGEWWNAELAYGEVFADDRVTVTGMDGYTLHVEQDAQKREETTMTNFDTWRKYLTDYNEGLGLVYERFVLNDFLDDLRRQYDIHSVLEAPLYGMAGVSGINDVIFARNGATVTMVDDNAERIRACAASGRKICSSLQIWSMCARTDGAACPLPTTASTSPGSGRDCGISPIRSDCSRARAHEPRSCLCGHAQQHPGRLLDA